MTEWTFSPFDDQSGASPRVMVSRDPIVFIGPFGPSHHMTSSLKDDPNWVSCYFARPFDKSDEHRALLRERWPNIEFDECDYYCYLPMADFALIKFEAF